MDEKKPLIEFKSVYQSKYFNVLVDTATDVCYIFGKSDIGVSSIQVMLTPDGKPRTLHYNGQNMTREEMRKWYLHYIGDSQTNIFSKGD